MSKTKKILVLSFSIIFSISLFTFAKKSKEELTKEKTAIMSIMTNLSINWLNESPDSNITSANSSTLLYDDLEKIITESFTQNNFILVSKDDIISIDEYKNAEESKLYIQNQLYTPKGYKLLPTKNKILQIINEKTDAKNFVYITVYLEKEMEKGFDKNGIMKARVTLYLDITNEFGNIINSAKSTVTSEETLNVIDGKYNTSVFRSFFPKIIKAAITNAITAL